MLARLAIVSGLLLLPTALVAVEPAESADFFEKKIRPLLTEHCLKCHGDLKGKEPKGGLRLDSRAAMLKGGDNGPALVPGDPAKSKLIEAVRFTNADLQMPPRGKLAEGAIADLVAWVKAGANWPNESGTTATVTSAFDLARRKQDHWAWHPIRPTAPPAVRDAHWPSDPVDQFVLSKLEEKNLKPAAPADPRSWIRRVTYDLTGLPPTAEDVEQFQKDPSKETKRKVVERLLESPQFGERWARHWLDLVRYAETRGHEFDPVIPNAYEYRDYVIRALNADVPYNQFVREHVAGDLLARPRLHPTQKFNESILGTGFWFLGEEVHSPVDIRQDQADRFDNRIDVLSKTFLGLTVACARCHDHKFDAISTKDYYSLYGIIESSTYRLARFESLDENLRVAEYFAELNRESSQSIARKLAEAAEPASRQVSAYLLAVRQLLQSGPSAEARVGELARLKKIDPDLLSRWLVETQRAQADRAHPLHLWAHVAPGDPGQFAARLAAARRANSPQPALPDIVIDYATCRPADWQSDEGSFGTGPVRPGQLTADGGSVRYADVAAAHYDRAWDVLQTPATAEVDRGAIGRRVRAGRTIRTPNFRITGGKVHYLVKGTGTAYAAVDGHTLIEGPLHAQLVTSFAVKDGFHWVTHDLSAYRGQPAHIEFTATPGSDLAIMRVAQADTTPPTPVADIWIPGEQDETVEDLARSYQSLVSGVVSALRNGPPTTLAAARTANFLLDFCASSEGLATELDCYVGARGYLAKEIKATSRLALAMWDGNGVDENVFVRGSPKSPGERVPRRFLEAFAGTRPIAAGGSGRLELANQMTDPARDPLIARVFVNRVWHHLFGAGIVASVDNFGVLGERPTHPALLDFLADRFVREGWSSKTLIRELVLSSTYAMSTHGDPAAAAADPQNLLLHRARLRRLEGEAIRDSLLAVSGRLDLKQFGPSVPIYLTPFLEGRGRPASGPLDGDGRRSIYLSVKRNFLSPMLLAFDTPIPFSTVGRRQVSNVPAQALILLNDPFVQQQAELWVKKTSANGGSASSRVQKMYLAAFQREPSQDEATACRDFIREQAARYGSTDADVRVWKDLAHTLLNTKEFIYLD